MMFTIEINAPIMTWSVNEERVTLQDSKFLIYTIESRTWDEITLIYFSKIPPLLLLGIITTMSGSSTFASWNIQATLRKDPAQNFLPPLSSPVSETAALVCQAQPACDESSTIFIILSHLLCRSSAPGEECVLFVCVWPHSGQHLPMYLHLFIQNDVFALLLCPTYWWEVRNL